MEVEEYNDEMISEGALYKNTCWACNSSSKYRCPKCSILSCSLDCVKKHKKDNHCDGMRDKAAFVPMEKFKDSNLHSDYHFLEDVGRTIDNAHRMKKNYGLLHHLPLHLFRLQCAARRRQTNLLILPVTFSKRKISTTYFRYGDEKIFWRLEWIFPQCDFSCSDERIDEEILLGECLDKYMLPEMCTVEEKLEYYHSMGHKGVSVLLKDENTPSKESRYILLKQNKSLKTNFKKKKIIEFPTLLVVPTIHLSCYIDEEEVYKDDEVNNAEVETDIKEVEINE